MVWQPLNRREKKKAIPRLPSLPLPPSNRPTAKASAALTPTGAGPLPIESLPIKVIPSGIWKGNLKWKWSASTSLESWNAGPNTDSPLFFNWTVEQGCPVFLNEINIIGFRSSTIPFEIYLSFLITIWVYLPTITLLFCLIRSLFQFFSFKNHLQINWRSRKYNS